MWNSTYDLQFSQTFQIIKHVVIFLNHVIFVPEGEIFVSDSAVRGTCGNGFRISDMVGCEEGLPWCYSARVCIPLVSGGVPQSTGMYMYLLFFTPQINQIQTNSNKHVCIYILAYEIIDLIAYEIFAQNEKIHLCSGLHIINTLCIFQDLGLTGEYKEKGPSHDFIRKVLALPLLPHEHIPIAFDNLRETATAPLQPLMAYVNTTWITGQWTPQEWSVYGQSIRTNNDCEGNYRLQSNTNN